MRPMRNVPLFLAGILALAGCETMPIAQAAPDVLSLADEPRYLAAPGHAIVPVACLRPVPRGEPSGCLVDTVFARQVAHPSDLVRPRAPGPAPTAPAARAAEAYIFGTDRLGLPEIALGGRATAANGVLIPTGDAGAEDGGEAPAPE